MKITEQKFRKLVREVHAKLLREQEYDYNEDMSSRYSDEVSEHGPVVNTYYPGGNMSQILIEFEDGYTMTERPDADEPNRFDFVGGRDSSHQHHRGHGPSYDQNRQKWR